MKFIQCIGILVTCGAVVVAHAATPELPLAEQAKIAVNRSLPLIQKSLGEYPHHASCFSCHHQGVGIYTVELARKNGFTVDKQGIADAVAHTSKDLRTDIALYQKGDGQPGGVTRAGYALLALGSAGAPRNETMAAVTGYLMMKDKDKPYWRSSSNRPPSELSAFTDTFLAISALKAFGDVSQKEAVDAKIEKTRKWLEETLVKETEDRVFQLWGLKESGATETAVQASAKALLSEQRADGGWSQLPNMESDAYATGSALTALLQTGSVTKDDPAVVRAVKYLLQRQLPDGSWHVVSRSKPFQPYFESGFPHVKDQFISMAASCWSTCALILVSKSGV